MRSTAFSKILKWLNQRAGGVIFGALCLALLSASPVRAAQEFPLYGGPGGGAFRFDCPSGHFMVGAKYRAGSWLDQIAVICAKIGPLGLDYDPIGPAFGGNGGNVSRIETCNLNQVITGAAVLLNSSNKFVKEIDFGCRSPYNGSYRSIIVGSPASIFPDHYQLCRNGEAITGIQGRAGLFIDAIGMICGALPEIAPSTPEPPPEQCAGLKEDPAPNQWVDMLRAHNERRAQHCVAPLKWSAELAQQAQAYAEKCRLGVHGSTGENLAAAWKEVNGAPVLPALTDREAFETTWYCENKNYDFNNPVFKGGSTSECKDVNGHFTQVVWKDSCQLGCGRADCDITDSNGIVHKGTQWVCRYLPAGNVNVTNVDVLKDQVRPGTCK
jgi:hypothetical protein